MKRLLALLGVCALILYACGGKDKPSEVVPTYAGNWGGTYSITSCSQNGQMALVDLCGSTPVGSNLTHRMEFLQSQRSLSGQFYLGSLLFAVSPTATIATDGSVIVQGTNRGDTTLIQATWTLHSGSTSSLNGTLTTVWSSTGLTGTSNLNGSTSSITPKSADSARLPAPATLRDAIERFLIQ